MNETSADVELADTAVTVAEAFEQTLRHHSQRPFLFIPEGCPGGPRQCTYAQVAAAAAERARWYEEAGYGRGHHVALLLDSRADFYLHWLALNALGATLVPIGAELVEDEIRSLLQFGDVDLVVCLSHRVEVARRAAHALPVRVVDVETGDGRLEPALPPRAAGLAAGAAAIVFTSGSTGRPKGCLLSNAYFLAFGRWYRDLGGRCALRCGRERIITALPPHHVNALAFSSMGALMSGGCVVQLDRFRSDHWWRTVRDSGATVMHYLGVMPGMLLKLPRDERERTHELRFGIGGGVRGTDHQEFEARFGVPLIEAWAMTETGGAGTLSTHLGPRHVGTGCIGQPSPRFAEAGIVDDDGNAVPAGRIGELVVRATGSDPRRGFFSGYYRDPQATQAVWQGGWLHSGDLARTDEQGQFFFVGRRKQIIRRSGENISAAEVEAVLAALPLVRQAAVVPVPDALREEEVFACIMADDGLNAGENAALQLMREAAARLSYYKLPGYIAFVRQLPTTSTQKLRYGAIIEMAQALIRQADPLLFDLRAMKRGFRPATGR